ncbi:hypothetical protein JCM10914A_50990 [Paenibacillus sp. JCM 10914]|nr:hypothetical protein JCM10914_1294 [Paenibacillus sp. JCM 10914]
MIVTHGGLITDYLTTHFTEHDLKLWHPDFIQIQSQLVSECSITKLQYHDGDLKLKSFASVTHLDIDQVRRT